MSVEKNKGRKEGRREQILKESFDIFKSFKKHN